MPAFAIGARRILVGIDRHQLRDARRMGCRRMNVKLAKPTGEGQMLLGRECLIAKKDDEVFGERAVNLVKLPIGNRLSQIDAADLRPDDGRQFVDPDRLIRRALGRHMANPGSRLGVQHGISRIFSSLRLMDPNIIQLPPAAAQYSSLRVVIRPCCELSRQKPSARAVAGNGRQFFTISAASASASGLSRLRLACVSIWRRRAPSWTGRELPSAGKALISRPKSLAVLGISLESSNVAAAS